MGLLISEVLNQPRLFCAFCSSVRVSWRFLHLYQPHPVASRSNFFFRWGPTTTFVCHNVHLTLKFVCSWILYPPSHPVISIKQTKRGPISFVFFLLSNGLLPLFDSSGRTGCWRPHQPLINSLDHQSADGRISTVTSQCYALRLRYVSVFLPFLFPFFFFFIIIFHPTLAHITSGWNMSEPGTSFDFSCPI